MLVIGKSENEYYAVCTNMEYYRNIKLENMKKRKGLLLVLFPIVITASMYVVFYSRIESKPSDAGFWLILALGISIGVALTRLIQWSNRQ